MAGLQLAWRFESEGAYSTVSMSLSLPLSRHAEDNDERGHTPRPASGKLHQASAHASRTLRQLRASSCFNPNCPVTRMASVASISVTESEMSQPTTIQPTQSDRDRQWFILSRWQQLEGEGRANLLRIVAIAVFYATQLFTYSTAEAVTDADRAFHRAATGLAVAGAVSALVILLCMQRRLFPPMLPFLSTASDLILVSALARHGGGPHSPLTFTYFLIVAMAGLRFRLSLVWFATAGAATAYMALVGLADPTWFDANHVVSPARQLMMVSSLGLTGIVIGQIVRRVHILAVEYGQRITGATSTKGLPQRD